MKECTGRGDRTRDYLHAKRTRFRSSYRAQPQVQHFSIKQSSRNEAKSLDHKIKVTDLHILDEVNLCITMIHDIHPSNNLEDIMQNH